MRTRPLLETGIFVVQFGIAGLLLLVFFPNLPRLANYLSGQMLAPQFYAGFLLLVGVLGMLDHRSFFAFLKTRYAQWSIAVLVLFLLNLLRLELGSPQFMKPGAQDVRDAVDRFQLFLLAPAFAYAAFATPPRYFRPFIVIIAFASPLLIIYDFLLPGSLTPLEKVIGGMSSERTRVGSAWGNQNAAAEAIVLAMLMARGVLGKYSMMIVMTLAAIAVVFTGSRSGLAAFAITGLWFIYKGTLPRYYLLLPLAVVLSFSTLIVVLDSVASSAGRDRGITNVIERLEFFNPTTRIQVDDSTIERGEVLMFAIAELGEALVLGHGIDYIDLVYEAGTHNLPVALFYQYGLAGLGAWLALLYILSLDPRSSALRLTPAALVFAWFSLFSHNIIENNHWLVFFAIMIYAKIPAPNQQNGVKLSKPPRRKRRRGQRSGGVPKPVPKGALPSN